MSICRHAFVASVVLIFVGFLTACAPPELPVSAEDGDIRVLLSTNQVLVGDTFSAAIEVDHPLSSVVSVPPLDRGDDLSVISRQVTTDDVDASNAVTRFNYTLQSFRPGFLDLTTNGISITSGDTTDIRSLPELSIEIRSSLDPDEVALSKLKDPVLWPRSSQSRLLLALGIVVLLALLIGAIALWIRRAQQPAPAIIIPSIPAHEQALKSLRDLKAEAWVEKGNFETYYVKLSDIVRHYLENRFALHAPEQTTEEFIREAAAHPLLNPEQKDRVQGFLVQSDLVKFARFTPTAAEADKAYDSAFRLVDETKETRGGAGSVLPLEDREVLPPDHSHEKSSGGTS